MIRRQFPGKCDGFYFFLIGLLTLDPNQMLSYRKHVQQDWSISISQLTFCFYNLLITEKLTDKYSFSLPTCGYECDKGCSAQRDWVQCKHFVSEAMQGNVKGNQLLWDHILLFKNTNIQLFENWSASTRVVGLAEVKLSPPTFHSCCLFASPPVSTLVPNSFSISFFGWQTEKYGWSDLSPQSICTEPQKSKHRMPNIEGDEGYSFSQVFIYTFILWFCVTSETEGKPHLWKATGVLISIDFGFNCGSNWNLKT